MGTQGNNLIQLDSLGKLPALDGSQLFNLPGGSGMIYPPAGIVSSTGSAWSASYAVGKSANNLVQLDANAKLPAVYGSALTNLLPYMAGTTANCLVQLDSLARLPAVDGSQLKNLPSGMIYPGAGIPYSTGVSWSTSISAVDNGIVQFSATGAPLATASIPAGTTIGGAYIYRAGGTDVAVADGGTGRSSWAQYAILFADSTSSLNSLLLALPGKSLQ